MTKRRAWRIIAGTVLLVLIAAIPAATVFPTLGTAGFSAPGDESSRAGRVVADRFPQGPPNLVLLVTVASTVDNPDVVRAGQALTARLSRESGVGPATSYWAAARDPALRTARGTRALVLARILGDEDAVKETMRRIHPLYSGSHAGLRVDVGGQPAAEREIQQMSRDDLARSELVAAPLVLLLLLLVFGSLVAALLPSLIALLAAVGTLAVLRLWSAFTEVSVFSLNLAIALSLGLAVDYSLFILARYREELAAGRDRATALRTTVRTAGHTVVYSAVTVAVSLAGMALFPLYYLRSFAYAGIAVVTVAALAAVVVLPAVLAVLGPRVADPSAVRLHAAGMWRRVAELVMRRPAIVAVGVVVFLLALGTPFLRASFQLPDDRLLPAGSEAHRVAEAVRGEFGAPPVDALYVTAEGLSGTAELGDYAAAVSRLPDVARVATAAGVYAGGARVGDSPEAPRFSTVDGRTAWVWVLPAVDQYSAEATRLVAGVRALDPPFTARVGGNSAHLVDTRATLGRVLPSVLAVMVGAILVLLFLFTGSVLIPVKAVVCNLLSLTATFGALVWVFQDGHLAGLLGGFQVTGQLEIFTPILMLCIAFGLSMDYEVFLVSRIHEAHLAGLPDREAVAGGLQQTGRLVTSAAAVLIVVLLANVTSQLTILKMLGLGLALAILVDATIVRAALVPAIMRLAGPANWWAPGPLRRLHGRIGLRERPSRRSYVARHRREVLL